MSRSTPAPPTPPADRSCSVRSKDPSSSTSWNSHAACAELSSVSDGLERVRPTRSRSTNTPSGGPVRPRFHLTAEAGWINDPHGITYREGRYHVFFQHAPGRITWNIGHISATNRTELT
ncbi:hypothetical protein [uncultured Microbacterium sp.]|uniref:hypothetical protein n=1 Tax=uncultured Microbacterium sp. TaxID=191216 RepID=UPI00344DD887